MTKRLTPKQVEALREIIERGFARSWQFGSTTVNRLRTAGLVRDDVTETAWGKTRFLVPTPAGRAALAEAEGGAK